MRSICNNNYFKDLYLDIYLPDSESFDLLIYFHGGGMVEGDKGDNIEVFKQLVSLGYAVASVNYSLYPNTKFPECLKDAAKAVKYIFDHKKEIGKINKIYITGSSAGAYITMMLCLNKEYLNEVELSPLDIDGYISESGQMSDHFNIQHFENGVDHNLQRITKLAPLYYVGPGIKVPPILLIWYSNDMFLRKEQNILLLESIKLYDKTADIAYIELEGTHCQGSSKLNKNNQFDYVVALDNWIKMHR